VLGKHTLSPDESTTLKVIYNTEGSPGPFQKRIYMKTNLPGRGVVTATISGTVKAAPAPKIEVTPRKIAMGEVQKDSLFQQRFQIVNSGQVPLNVKRIYSPRTDVVLTTALSDGLTIQPGQTTSIELSFRPNRSGSVTEVFFFDTNARNARNGQYAVMLIGRVND
jgi:hypothetical protein